MYVPLFSLHTKRFFCNKTYLFYTIFHIKSGVMFFFLKLSVLRLDTTFFSFLSVLVRLRWWCLTHKAKTTRRQQTNGPFIECIDYKFFIDYILKVFTLLFSLYESVFFIIILNFSLICSVFSYTHKHNVHVSKNSVKDMHYHTFVSRAVSYVVWNW